MKIVLYFFLNSLTNNTITENNKNEKYIYYSHYCLKFNYVLTYYILILWKIKNI